MGFLDFFGGTPANKALKLKPKVTQKYGDPTVRQKAIAQLGELKVPEAVTVLLARFTVNVDPQSTDIEEKEHVFELICGLRQDAVEPLKEFLRTTDLASSWAVRIFSAILPELEVIGIVTELLNKLGAQYTRNPEKKLVLLHFLEGKDDPRIAPTALPFLEDMSDDVKIAALKVLGPLQHEPAREPMLQLLASEDTARRVKTAATQAVCDSGFGVQGFREKVEAAVQDPYFVDKSGLIKKRG